MRRITWLGIVACMFLFFGMSRLQSDDPPKPLPTELVRAWRKVGAEIAWIKFEDESISYLPAIPTEPGWLPAIRIPSYYWRVGMLKGLPAPEIPFSLRLLSTKVADSDLKDVSRFEQLTSLDLESTRVTDAGIKQLAQLKQITWLILNETLITDVGLKELVHLKQLKLLCLSNTRVTNAGLKHLAGFEQLVTLDLSRTKIMDAGLKELVHLKQLKLLDLSETRVTDAEIAKLQKALPKCKIQSGQ